MSELRKQKRKNVVELPKFSIVPATIPICSVHSKSHRVQRNMAIGPHFFSGFEMGGSEAFLQQQRGLSQLARCLSSRSRYRHLLAHLTMQKYEENINYIQILQKMASKWIEARVSKKEKDPTKTESFPLGACMPQRLVAYVRNRLLALAMGETPPILQVCNS